MQDGVLIVDKPAGMSSAQVVANVKKCLRARKVGHAGTLDPSATGVLVCLINRATRLARFFLSGKKQYQATLCLGIDTDTQDAAGRVLDCRAVPDFSKDHLQRVFDRFVGNIEQAPPVYSALKYKGVPLYKLARSGHSVQKPARRVNVERLTIHRIALPEVSFSVTCSGGTYIRALCADIGRQLGCGGHLRELRRNMSSGFTLDEAISLEALKLRAADSRLPLPLVPLGDALKGMPTLKADRATAAKIKFGGALALTDFTDLPPDATAMTNGEQGTYCKVFDSDQNLIAVVAVHMHRETIAYCGVFT
jgi:tRNA pseudouridine55 synthase